MTKVIDIFAVLTWVKINREKGFENLEKDKRHLPQFF